MISGHSYSVIKVVKVKSSKTYLIQLRNPHGQNEWNGDWSDDDDKWNQLYGCTLNKLGYVSNKNDGEFFMSLEDFRTYFGTVEFCHLNVHDNSNYLHFHGNWNLASFVNNDKFSKSFLKLWVIKIFKKILFS